MDVDDDDKYMSAAAAHAVFVMTVSAARMYWLLCHAQHARDINIHKLHPLPEKKLACRSANFLQSGIGYVKNSRVHSIIDFFADFSQNFSERALLILKSSITISITKIGTVEAVTMKKVVLVPCRFQSRFQ